MAGRNVLTPAGRAVGSAAGRAVGSAVGSARSAAAAVGGAPHVLRGLVAAGVVAPMRPQTLLGLLTGLGRTGLTIAAAAAIGAVRHPDRAAVVDERGRLTFAQLEAQSARIAAGLRSTHGVGRGHRVGILCRNHRGFVVALAAASRAGADLVLLNTESAAPQLTAILAREGVRTLVTDEEFLPAVRASGFSGACVLAWTDDPEHTETLDTLAWRGGEPVRPPVSQGRVVIMTSGTTGTPRGAGRQPDPIAVLTPMASVLNRVPLRAGEAIVILPPVYHALGLAFLLLGLFIGSPVVLRRRFDPGQALGDVQQYRAGSLVAVPVMLQRVLELPAERRRDTRSLRAVVSGGSALRPDLAGAFMDAFGEILYNVYGSSEAAFGSLASPDQLRRAPGTVGVPTHGTTVRILDTDGEPMPVGQVGRVHIASALGFDGYTDDGHTSNNDTGAGDTGAGGQPTVDGLLATGDLGHFDHRGLLFVDGPDPAMIVSGGENVFPPEVEGHPARQAEPAHPSLPVRRPRHSQHDLLAHFLDRARDIHVPLVEQGFRLPRRPAEQRREFVVRHRQPAHVVEVALVHRKGSVVTDVQQLLADGARILRPSVRREPHHLEVRAPRQRNR